MAENKAVDTADLDWSKIPQFTAERGRRAADGCPQGDLDRAGPPCIAAGEVVSRGLIAAAAGLTSAPFLLCARP